MLERHKIETECLLGRTTEDYEACRNELFRLRPESRLTDKDLEIAS